MSDIETFDSAPGRGKPASFVTSKITDKVNDLLKIYARMTTSLVARCLCISTGSTYKILKKKIRVSRIAARWIPIHCWMAKREVVFRLPVKNA